jgi:hypothetical protein
VPAVNSGVCGGYRESGEFTTEAAEVAEVSTWFYEPQTNPNQDAARQPPARQAPRKMEHRTEAVDQLDVQGILAWD